MKTKMKTMILAAGCAVLLAMPLSAMAQSRCSDSRHPDPRGRPHAAQRHQGHARSRRSGAPAPVVWHVPPPPVYYAPQPVYYAPPPVYYAPPPVVYCPRPAMVYPARPGVHVVLSF